ncbi:hypothetical protein ED733_000620 [Metarhizium rileyi]|uniref:Rhodopsin domain-containing protein n=1 Tax=Metarhizium rileyi (strain RCEF 4871) TaxID=1649241 RepID=A0A5C6GCG1_METRR|nr:hypothetical protein ED733_000620 [Metarhizium rileyi]
MAKEGLGQVVSWYICAAAAVLFLFARLCTRYQRLSSLGMDDALITIAACCLIGDLVIQQYMWNLGMAEIAHASRDNFIKIMEMIVPGSILYVTSLWAIKMAMVLFYKKLAAPGTKLQMIYSVVLSFLVLFWAIIFFDIIFQCYPHDKRWSLDPTYQCDSGQANINYWLTVLSNIITDVIIISLPISMVLKLQMKLKLKLGVIAIFALGFFVVITSIIRAYYSKRSEPMLTCTVSMIETAVAIIASCLPPLRTLFIGPASSAGTKPNRGHYELSSGGNCRTWRASRGRNTTDVIGGTRSRDNSSEDKLVHDLCVPPSCPSTQGNDKNGEIKVDTTFQVHYGTDEEAANQSTKHGES